MEDPKYPCLPKDLAGLSIISYGMSGVVLKVSDSAVVKIALGDLNQPALSTEYKIYKRLGSHRFITKLFYEQEGRLVLERLQYPLRKRLDDLSNSRKVLPLEYTLRWAFQLTEALHHVHSCGIMQVDIGTHNVLLDWDNNVKLVDFAGSSIDGSRPSVYPGVRYANPNICTPSVKSEIFALGSMLHEVETARQPYHDKSDSETEKLFVVGKFPDTGALMLGRIILRCWQSKYDNVLDVLKDIKHICEVFIESQNCGLEECQSLNLGLHNKPHPALSDSILYLRSLLTG